MIHMSATLMDCPWAKADEPTRLEDFFCDRIEEIFGSLEAARDAKAAADAVYDRLGGWPDDRATPEDVAAYERWDDAYHDAERNAFAGWKLQPEASYFDVEFHEAST